MLYSIRSERLLVEEIDYSILFRWFVGMNLMTIATIHQPRTSLK
jgi:transposase